MEVLLDRYQYSVLTSVRAIVPIYMPMIGMEYVHCARSILSTDSAYSMVSRSERYIANSLYLGILCAERVICIIV